MTMGDPDEQTDGVAPGGEASRKEAIPPRYSNAFQSKQEADQFAEKLGQQLVDNLKRNVLAEAKELEPGADWSAWMLGERTFRVSPDRKEARELMPDGYWQIVVAEYVFTRAEIVQATTMPASQRSN